MSEDNYLSYTNTKPFNSVELGDLIGAYSGMPRTTTNYPTYKFGPNAAGISGITYNPQFHNSSKMDVVTNYQVNGVDIGVGKATVIYADGADPLTDSKEIDASEYTGIFVVGFAGGGGGGGGGFRPGAGFGGGGGGGGGSGGSIASYIPVRSPGTLTWTQGAGGSGGTGGISNVFGTPGGRGGATTVNFAYASNQALGVTIEAAGGMAGNGGGWSAANNVTAEGNNSGTPGNSPVVNTVSYYNITGNSSIISNDLKHIATGTLGNNSTSRNGGTGGAGIISNAFSANTPWNTRTSGAGGAGGAGDGKPSNNDGLNGSPGGAGLMMIWLFKDKNNNRDLANIADPAPPPVGPGCIIL